LDHNSDLTLDKLPSSIPLFPLPGAMLFPRWGLPLNIFEPRYLNMIDDAMDTHRLIGMVQTVGGDRASPELASIGCVGRIMDHSETEDGRYLITLIGMVRFRIDTELDATKPYRQAQVDYSPFTDDLADPQEFASPDHDMIITALEPYAKACGLEANWDSVTNASIEELVSALCAGCPFDVMEKQALLEAPDLQSRAKMLIQLMTINTSQANKNGGESLQ
jgi:Lon protease-like protein